jgi:hypothetical protein
LVVGCPVGDGDATGWARESEAAIVAAVGIDDLGVLGERSCGTINGCMAA